MLDKASYTPLYIQVREYILNRIRMGDYKAVSYTHLTLPTTSRV